MRALNPLRATDFLTTLCYHSHISVLQPGLCLHHILRLRWLVYSLYTFINNRLFLKLHLPISLSVLAVTQFSLFQSPSCPNTYYLIQHGVLLAIRRFSQLLLFEFPQRHSPFTSARTKVCSVYRNSSTRRYLVEPFQLLLRSILSYLLLTSHEVNHVGLDYLPKPLIVDFIKLCGLHAKHYQSRFIALFIPLINDL